MIRDLLKLLPLLAIFALLLPASECIPIDDDDDAADDDDDAADDDDDSAYVAPFTITGTVTAIDRDTGTPLTPEEFAARSGPLIVYVFPDPDDLTVAWAKVVLEMPGEYEVVVPGDAGAIHATVIADYDNDQVISARDVRREYAFNPINTVPGEDVEDVDLIIDLAPYGPGGPGADSFTTISGDANLVNVDDGPIRITANDANYFGPIYGCDCVVPLAGAGPYSITVRDDLDGGVTTLLGYLDRDGNGLFEFTDWIGEANANPLILGIGDVEGVQIDIPSGDDIAIPMPSPYVSILGTVEYGGYSSGDILVHASVDTPWGQTHDFELLGAPGDFSLRVPANTERVMVWAILDEDGDGNYDFTVDAFGSHGPIDVGGDSITDVVISLAPGAGAGSISGTVFYEGDVTSLDVLHIGLNADPKDPAPTFGAVYTDVTFPFEFTFPGVTPGDWWIGAFLDIDGDNPLHSGAGADEPQGTTSDPIVLPPTISVTGAELTLVIN
jgi:hypothetical protein